MRGSAGTVLALAAVLLAAAVAVDAFYVPGVAPQDFTDGEVVGIKVRAPRRAPCHDDAFLCPLHLEEEAFWRVGGCFCGSEFICQVSR